VTQQRLDSVDALRGLTVAAMLLVNTPGDWGHIYAPLRHADWHGCTPTDLIFPFFLFVVGVSIALGIVPKVERGDDILVLRRGILWRATRIVALGLALHLIAWALLDQDAFRPWGVLQRIGLCFAACGLIALRTRAAMQWAIIAVLLLGYWVLLEASGGLAPWSNLASRIDAAMLGPHAYLFDPASGRGHDPEGLLSTLPAIATTLLGLRAGAWLRAGETTRMAVAGVLLAFAGWTWSLVFPLNKNMWTSSYVLWSGGWATLALVVMHVLIDRRGWPAVGRSLGINAIVVYAGAALMVYVLAWLGLAGPIYQGLFAAWMTPRFGPYLPSLVFAVVFTAGWWVMAWWMQRRGLRVTI
jgi:predicted acyltransferase